MEIITEEFSKVLAVWDSSEYDEDMVYDYFDDFLYEVQDMINRMRTKNFFCYGLNLTWRNVAGYTKFKTTDARTLIDNITPNTDFSIKFLKTDKKGVIEVVTYHHDAPTGEVMYLMSQSMEKKLGIMDKYFKN
mgnify:CR=1 FL=1